MGKSFTIPCVGVPRGEAFTKTELAQEEHKAKKRGEPILYWYAQTKTGKRILDGRATAHASELRLPKLVTCPVCEGEGGNGRHFCPVCNGSGICRKGNERKWMPWQIERMRAERIGAEASKCT